MSSSGCLCLFGKRLWDQGWQRPLPVPLVKFSESFTHTAGRTKKNPVSFQKQDFDHRSMASLKKHQDGKSLFTG